MKADETTEAPEQEAPETPEVEETEDETAEGRDEPDVTEWRDIMCVLTEAEQADRGEELADMLRQIAEQESVVKDAKTVIKQCQEEEVRLTSIILNHQELRRIECLVFFDFTVRTATIQHPETGAVIQVRSLTTAELSPDLPFEDEPEGDETTEPEAPETQDNPTEQQELPALTAEPVGEEPPEGNEFASVDGWTSQAAEGSDGDGKVHCFANGKTTCLCGAQDREEDAALLESEFFLDAQLCQACRDVLESGKDF